MIALCRSLSVWPGTKSGFADHTAESSATLTLWASARSTSVKASVCTGVVSGVGDPTVSGCSVSDADCGPLVIATGSLEPVMSTSNVWVAVAEPSLTVTL